MNEIWANRLVAETKRWEDVPPARREGVRACLAARVAGGALTREKYREITGEEYAE